MRIASLLLASSTILLLGLGAASETDAKVTPSAVLVFSKTAGFRHDSIPEGIAAIRAIAASNEGTMCPLTVTASEDAAVFNEKDLGGYRAVIFLSTTGDILNDEQQRAFEAWYRKGGAYVGIHAAADTEHTWPWYGLLVGAWFKTHPPTQKAVVVVEDRTHQSTSMLPERWERVDEWYVYKENPRTKKEAPVHVLAAMDEKSYDTGGHPMGDHPIAWCHEFEGGRAWYTGGGHTKESFSEPLFREHIRQGIAWTLKRTTEPYRATGEVGTAPKPGASARE